MLLLAVLLSLMASPLPIESVEEYGVYLDMNRTVGQRVIDYAHRWLRDTSVRFKLLNEDIPHHFNLSSGRKACSIDALTFRLALVDQRDIDLYVGPPSSHLCPYLTKWAAVLNTTVVGLFSFWYEFGRKWPISFSQRSDAMRMICLERCRRFLTFNCPSATT